MKGTARTSGPSDLDREVQRVTLFVSYSHADDVWMKRLGPIFNGLRYDDRAQGRVDLDRVSAWHDQEIIAGDRWDAEIKQALERMRIFVPLVSHDFFASKYIMEIELEHAKSQHAKGQIDIVPILLHDVNLQKKCSFLHQFIPLPAYDRCWSSFAKYAQAMRPIDDGLWLVIERVLNGSATKPPA